MECPFKIPVKPVGEHFAEGFYFRAECDNGAIVFLCPTKADLDYIVQAINIYEKFEKLVQDLVACATKYPDDYATKDLNKLIPFVIKEAIEALKEKP